MQKCRTRTRLVMNECVIVICRNPNREGLAEWPEYNVETKQHLVLKKNISQSSNLKKDHVHFWKVTAKNLLQQA